MDLIPEADFLAWATEHGIAPDSRFQYSAPLIYKQQPDDLTRFWLPQPIVSELPGFVFSAIRAASEGPYILRPRGGGTWFVGRDDVPIRNQVLDNLMAKCNVPREFAGALRFRNDESRELLLIVVNYYVFAWSVGEDLNILPSDGSCILMVSHHGELQGTFPNSARRDAFVTFMEEQGYPLPDDVPDSTFKIPSWMRSRGGTD